jgi:hypothetical protein
MNRPPLDRYRQSSSYAGIGFAFSESDPFCGLDLDDCLDEQGHLLWGGDLLEVFDCYTEVSPSGRGLKLFFRGRKPGFARCTADWLGQGKIELYDQKRWFATTGRRFERLNGDVLDRQQELDALCTQLWSPRTPDAGSRVQPAVVTDPCLNSMLRMQIGDHNDGSHRLYSACCRAVEHNLTDAEAITRIRDYERVQPFPRGWSDAEIVKRLRDAERTCARGSARRQLITPNPRPLGRLMLEFPELREPVIHGLLRQGETLTVIANPKAGKSWLATDVALSVATGRPLFETFFTQPGSVLVLDNELHPQTVADRNRKVTAARGIGASEISDRVCIECLRGRLLDIFAMQSYFDGLAPGQFQVIILDALYRFLPAGTDENNNAQMAAVFNQIDAYAERLGASFIAIHHTSKGSQSGKSITDVGAGAGALSRATDSHLILRPHEEPACAVLEAAVRSWPPVDPRVLRWTFPVWVPDTALDPARLRVEQPRRRERQAPDEPESVPDRWTAGRFVETFLNAIPQPLVDILDAADDAGLSERRTKKLLRSAERRGLVFPRRPAANRQAEYATEPPAESPSKTDQVRALLLQEPSLSNRDAARRLQLSHTLVNSVRREIEQAGNVPCAPLETA